MKLISKWVVIASGASLTQEDVDYCKGRAAVLCVNNAYQLAPWAAALYACDAQWWNHYNPRFLGRKITASNERLHGDLQTQVERIEAVNREGISQEAGVVHTGGNSGFQAVNLAYLWGATHIYLLGFDMQETNGKKHFFGAHPQPLQNTAHWHIMAKRMDAVAMDYAAAGVTVINCTRETALKAYRRAAIEDVL
jgi:hypothetical protein